MLKKHTKSEKEKAMMRRE
jgi:hypothetical protein